MDHPPESLDYDELCALKLSELDTRITKLQAALKKPDLSTQDKKLLRSDLAAARAVLKAKKSLIKLLDGNEGNPQALRKIFFKKDGDEVMEIYDHYASLARKNFERYVEVIMEKKAEHGEQYDDYDVTTEGDDWGDKRQTTEGFDRYRRLETRLPTLYRVLMSVKIGALWHSDPDRRTDNMQQVAANLHNLDDY